MFPSKQSVWLMVCIVTLAIRCLAQEGSLPHLQRNGQAIQLMVDQKPYLMLGGELHNSTASDLKAMPAVLDQLVALHLNTVVSTVSWELVEPQEGHFDFSTVDSQIELARQRHLHLVLIWFGTWKNTASGYPPIWVKEHESRFPWRVQKDPAATQFVGTHFYSLSPFSDATMQADAKAFAQVMRHIREKDTDHTVLMMQVENETGFLGESRDYSPAARAAWRGPVPEPLMAYLKKHRSTLLPETLAVWGRGGFREKGNWDEVFGSDADADEVFMAWAIGSYTGRVAEAGKAELSLPMYANAWLVQDSQQKAGGYPSGGPVSRMMDIWRAAAPALSFFAPDIYINDFEGVCASYTRSGNPLFIPEARNIPGNLAWAIGNFDTLGVSPFGIEDSSKDSSLGSLYAILQGAMPTLLKAQAAGKLSAFPPGTEGEEALNFGGFHWTARYGSRGSFMSPPSESQVRHIGKAATDDAATKVGPAPAPRSSLHPITGGERGYALLMAGEEDDVYLIGTGITLRLEDQTSAQGTVRFVGSVDEGNFDSGVWRSSRRLNGDEGSIDLQTITLPPGPVSVRHVVFFRHHLSQ